MTDPQAPSQHPGLQPGERAPDFVLPPRDGGLATFYETYCGRPAALLLADGADRFADWPSLSQRWLAIVPGPPGRTIEGPVPMIGDDGRLRRALIGEDRPPDAGTVIALVFADTLRLDRRIGRPTPAEVGRVLARLSRDRGPPATRSAATPVLTVPDLFPEALCRRLIAAHDADNAQSGMVRIVDGQPALVADPAVKIRRDHTLTDEALAGAVADALGRRLLPEIQRAFNYPVTRFERFKVVVYDATAQGHFGPHRDNTTPDAAHRRFALTVNLNHGGRRGDYQGGRLVFPEYGPDGYGPPAGTAIVFSGGLLHAVEPVTKGRRYALITFLWGEDARRGRGPSGAPGS